MKTIFLLLMISPVTAFASADTSFTPKYSTILSGKDAGLVLMQCSRGTPKDVSGGWEIKQDDINKMEAVFTNILKLKAAACCMLGKGINDLTSYGFQYVGLIVKGKRFIYINAFKVPARQDIDKYHKGWRTNAVVACDGGNSFWGTLYDVEAGVFSELSFNGIA